MNNEAMLYLFIVATVGIFCSAWLFDLFLIFFLKEEAKLKRHRFVWLPLSHKLNREYLSEEGKVFLRRWRTGFILTGTAATMLIGASLY
ncbi:MAG: hypothetical protein HEP70_11495 [Rhodobiaceae bacterium]|nr:hypothetical protein [Rhodobiaceae bacterium]